MKILILSDCHYKKFLADQVLQQNASAELIIFLGDGEDNIRDIPLRFPTKAFIGLRGNCDFCSSFPLTQTFEVDNVRFFCTHGHLYHVKTNLAALKKAACDDNAHVALFGHTHRQILQEENGLLLLNPGSITNGDYALLETNHGATQAFLCHYE